MITNHVGLAMCASDARADNRVTERSFSTRLRGRLAYTLALSFSSVVLFLQFLLIPIYLEVHEFISVAIIGHGEPRALNYLLAITPFLAVIVSAIGTSGTIFFGWRADRRHARELALKVAELEATLSRLKPLPIREQAHPAGSFIGGQNRLGS
jgi:NADH:ubiquinone oxidoreductase subunit H